MITKTFLYVSLLTVASLAFSATPKKVAVIGTTGQLGRETIQQLSSAGIAVKCLLRHDISNVEPPSCLQDAKSSAQVAAYINTLPNVECITGDINDETTLRTLVEGTTACLALHGAGPPKPIFRALIPALFFSENDPTHAKQVNYVGIQRLLTVMNDSKSCKHLIRITGKGENPWSIFSILINALGGVAKGWNYEAEQLIRNSPTIDYTIIRPGIMQLQLPDTQEVRTLGLSDNGGDLAVTPVSYRQIAGLVLDSLQHANLQRTTVTAMNVVAKRIDQVERDTRVFPKSLIAEHKKAARVGGLAILTVMVGFMQLVTWSIGKVVAGW